MLNLALKIAVLAHQDQTDKGGVPYIGHPIAVSQMVEREDEKIVALLHDVIEDSNITIEDLKWYGFPEEILCAISLLTKRNGTPYQEYLSNLKENDLARAVKIADLTHNSDLSRLKKITEEDRLRKEQYEKAIRLLCSEEI